MTEVIKNLENTIAAFAMAVRTANIDWENRPAVEKWSNREILGHLIDSAQINLQRFVRCVYEENFKLIYQQNEWVSAQAYQQASISDLIPLWIGLNRQILNVWKHYPADRLTAQCDTGKDTVSFHTVEWLSADYIVHMRHHLNKILE